MRPNKVRQVWGLDQPVMSGWLSIGNSYSAEIVAMTGVDCVTVDLQHAMTDVQSMIGMLQAISTTSAAPFVRVPSDEASIVMKVLDAGSYGIICPMVNTAAQARALVEASSYPPIGGRSFGPARGLLYGGPDYAAHANETIVRLAMIETRDGLNAVEEICRVDGIDGIFIGPNDLGLAMGKGAVADPIDKEVGDGILHCLRAAKAVKKHAGIFCPSGTVAARRVKDGFDFLVLNSDANLLKQAQVAELAAARAAMDT